MNHPPEHCPRCGAGLEPVDPPTIHRCPACAEPVFYNPTPSARVLVLETGEVSEVEPELEPETTTDHGDGDGGADGRGGDEGDPPQASGHDPDEPRVLLVTRPDGVWITPGGAIEAGAQPREHAARELREETGLVVPPAALRWCRTATVEVHPDRHATSLVFAVRRADTTGTPTPGSDAGRARFWSVPRFEAADARFRELHRDRPGYESLAGWVRAGQEALG